MSLREDLCSILLRKRGPIAFKLARRETGLSPAVKHFYTHTHTHTHTYARMHIHSLTSMAVLLLRIICVIYVLSCLFNAALWSPVGKWRTSWLLFVMFLVVLLLSHLVS